MLQYSSVWCASCGSPGPSTTVGAPRYTFSRLPASVLYAAVRGSGCAPRWRLQISNTPCTHSSSGEVHTAGMSENTSSSASPPRSFPILASRVWWSIPGSVRISTPMVAASGTMLTPCPPSKVPTFIVGRPITGCSGWAKSNASSFDTARAAL